ncbi:hypothetical protein [Bradyrhizobium glycinis]|uniref:hypothetical protein n=1 Tax=Bradyrhizobium glycinis TaxID=2751812 RepID=UPI0018D7F99F|nr:hypothetical protein [Bradyrhizobium glycinis]MBH5367176.1 hypothetical protein [Bradyrhizobium glycinis]
MKDADLFSLLVAAEKLADTVATDGGVSADDRKVAERLRDAMKAWKPSAYRFRDYKTGGKA